MLCPLNRPLMCSDPTIERPTAQDPRVPRLRSVPGSGPTAKDGPPPRW